MKRLIAIVAATLLFTSCGEDPSVQSNTQPEVPAVTGSWESTFPALPAYGVPYPIDIRMDFTEASGDTLFSILVNENRGDSLVTLYTSDGTASLYGADLTITGSDCMVLDTVSREMIAVDDAECQEPMVFDILQISGDVWKVKGSTMERLPIIPEEKKAIISSITIDFNRVFPAID